MYESIVKNLGGVIVFYNKTFDGVRYQYQSRWNSEEAIDRFIDTYPVSRHEIAYIGSYLTLFFSVDPR